MQQMIDLLFVLQAFKNPVQNTGLVPSAHAHIDSMPLSEPFHKPGVSEPLAQQIKQYAMQKGFVRRGKNTAEADQKQKKILLLVADVFLKTQNTMYIDFYKKILDALQKKNIIGILNIINEQETASCTVPEILHKSGIDMLL